MLTTVAVLVIVLGLMVSLARHVREREAVALTKDLIRRLDVLMERYADRHAGRMPEVAAFPPAPPESAADAPASQPAGPRSPGKRDAPSGDPPAPSGNPPAPSASPAGPPASNASSAGPSAGPRRTTPTRPESFDRRALLEAARVNNLDFVRVLRREPTLTAPALKNMPVSMYDENYLRDAWGNPIVFMPAMHPLVGTAPRDRSFFFFSAGPDREYLTQEDNLYSYEERVMGVK